MTDDSNSEGASRDRKAEHIELALDPRAQLRSSAFDGYYLEHQALPEIDLAAVDCSTTFLGRELADPGGQQSLSPQVTGQRFGPVPLGGRVI